ncbi:MAG: hypothetical protein JWP63_306 [Candidatus Solibacter sp.]|jgi:hypothetical protein|nr:hypothetical protein [Candidatus Solibacter sp.]
MVRVFRSVLVLLAASFLSYAAAIDVTYTVNGSAGAWDLNFAVSNNMTAWPQQDIYQFGVALSAPGVTGSPAGYDPTLYATWTNFFLGGSAIFYNNIWFDGSDFNHLLPGTGLAGFTVTVADLVAPTSVAWFAFSVPVSFDPADIYTGSDSFNIDPDFLTAGFEGDAAAVPEPAPPILLAFGFATCGFLRRLRR